METKHYRLRVNNAFGTLTETTGYFAFTDALQTCVKLAKESIDPEYLKKCELGDWKIEGGIRNTPVTSHRPPACRYVLVCYADPNRVVALTLWASAV